jgi:hypothetical protein|tara:strand:+ start:455 stop:721 length:267 start_codon:yes stop_codon:yes gene_type:complete
VEVVVVDQDLDLTMQEDLVDHQVVDLTVNQQLQEQQVPVILEKQMQYPLLLDGVMLVVLVSLANLIHKVEAAVALVALALMVDHPEEE